MAPTLMRWIAHERQIVFGATEPGRLLITRAFSCWGGVYGTRSFVSVPLTLLPRSSSTSTSVLRTVSETVSVRCSTSFLTTSSSFTRASLETTASSRALLHLDRALPESILGTADVPVDGSPLDLDMLLAQAHLFADRRLDHVGAHAHRPWLDVALADVSRSSATGITSSPPVARSADVSVEPAPSSLARAVACPAVPVLRSTVPPEREPQPGGARPALSAPGLGPLVDVDRALVVQDIEHALVVGIARAARPPDNRPG